MITNIVAVIIVTLVTNVVNTDNAVWGPQYGVMYPEGGSPQEVKKPATERYVTTEVYELTAIQFEWPEGVKKGAEVSRKLLSSVTAITKLKEDWQDGGLRTNDVHSATAPTYVPQYKVFLN